VLAKSCPVTKRHPNCLRRLATEDERRATAVGFVSDFSRSPLHPVSTKARNRTIIRVRGFLKPGTLRRTATCLRYGSGKSASKTA
jgi:hypothetical protein